MLVILADVETGETLHVQLDREDMDAVNWKLWRFQGGQLRVKAPAWRRWRSFSEYLTGTECSHRNRDRLDFRRENLTPALAPWKCPTKKWT